MPRSLRYKLGKRPPKGAPALRLGPLLTGVVPDHPASEDYLAALPGWNLLGNDRYGDCVAVTWANVRRLVSATIGDGETYPGIDQVYALYKTQNPAFPAQDDGMDIQTLLEYLVHHEGPDGVKAVAFAAVDHTNLEEVKAALAIFGYLWIGFTVIEANFGQFNAGKPWTYVANSPAAGGHSVITGGYLSTPGEDERFVTWARETGCTDEFWARQIDEAWVVIWPEHLLTRSFLAGVNVAALAADYRALTGRELPIIPAPAPFNFGSWLRAALVTLIERIIGFFKRR